MTREVEADAAAALEAFPWVEGLYALDLTIYFAQSDGSGGLQLYVARRPSPGAPFGAPIAVPIAAPSNVVATPFVSASGRELFYQALTTSNGYDLWRVELESDGGLGVPEELSTVNSQAAELEPALSFDERTLYFYSERGSSSPGTIWMSRRDSVDEAFRTPTLIAELAPEARAFADPGWISPDDCRLYFYSNMDPTTAADIYVAERAPSHAAEPTPRKP